MEIFKNAYFVATSIVICVIIFYMASTGRFFGKFINKFFPCNQNPANSFPCFAGYDLAIMIISAIVGVIFLGILIFDIYKLLK